MSVTSYSLKETVVAKNKVELLTSDKALRVLKVEELQVDPSYQRGLVPKHKKIAAEFDPSAFGVPLVGQREDGSLWVVDGQQRIAALGIRQVKTVRCDVFRSKGPEHEAEVFKLVNANRTNLKPLELFKAKLAGHDEEAWEIKRLVEGAGLKIGITHHRAGKPDDWKIIMAVNSLINVLRRHGRECLIKTLYVCRECWPGDTGALNNDMLMGVSLFLKNRELDVDEDHLFPRFRTVQPSKIAYQATLGVGSREAQVAGVLERLSKKRKV